MWKVTAFFLLLGLANCFVLRSDTKLKVSMLRKVSLEEKLKHQQETIENLQKAFPGVDLVKRRAKMRILAGLAEDKTGRTNVFTKDVGEDNSTYYIGGDSIPEVNENAGILEYLYEGDILLSEEQLDNLMAKKNLRQKRSMTSASISKWRKEKPNNYTIVPYEFHPFFPPSKQLTTQAAMKFIESNTCVRFRTPTKASDTNYIQIIKGGGCYSSVGMIGGKQQLSLGDGCLHFTTTAIHELFAINQDVLVLVAKNAFSTYQYGMGHHQVATFYDIVQINKHYCQDKCRNSQTKCLNGGIIDPNNCNSCICPEPMSGPLCNTLSSDIKTVLATASGNKFFVNIGAENVYTYQPELSQRQVMYRVQAPAGKRIRINIEQMDGVMYPKKCAGGGVEIKFKKDLRSGGAVFCMGMLYSTPIVSETNIVYIIGRSLHNFMHAIIKVTAV